MSEQPKRKRGRPLKGDRPAKRIGFYVSADDHEWLTALPNRSEWIAKQIDRAIKEGQKSDTGAASGAEINTDLA